jgi:DNA-directed RNA polymerase specialized sigma24 family protein
MVYNLAYRLLGAEELAVAATEATLARAFYAHPRRREPAVLWLVRVAVGCCQEELGRLPLVSARSASIEVPVPEPMRAPVALSFGLKQPWDEIQDLLNAIPIDQRIAVVLADLYGLRYREIAGVTGVSVRKVCRNLSLGRSALRDGLVKRGALAASV